MREEWGKRRMEPWVREEESEESEDGSDVTGREERKGWKECGERRGCERELSELREEWGWECEGTWEKRWTRWCEREERRRL